jgi:hypothetical protein
VKETPAAERIVIEPDQYLCGIYRLPFGEAIVCAAGVEEVNSRQKPQERDRWFPALILV